MKVYLGLVLICSVGVALGLPNKRNEAFQSSEGKVFLFGGAMKDSSASAYNALREATGKLAPKIAVAISAAGSLEIGLEAFFEDLPGDLSYQTLFQNYGFQPSVIELAMDNYQTASSSQDPLGQANILLVQEADVIFFNGGDQSRHSRSWFNNNGSDSDIMKVLRTRFAEGAIVAGTSAGSAIISNPTYGEGYSYGYYYFNSDLKPCAIGDLLRDDRNGTNSFRYDENGGYMTGFGFVSNALVDTHFDARGRFGRLAVAMHDLSKPYGIGVGEDTCLYINKDSATVYGNDGVWFMDSSDALFPIDTYFNAKDIKITYLTEGDTLNLSTKVVTSTKQLITSVSGSAVDSDDIFTGTEGIDSIKSLVSSSSSDSIGYSYEAGPTTRVVFYKGKGEKAYRSGQKYTIDKLLMDIGTL